MGEEGRAGEVNSISSRAAAGSPWWGEEGRAGEVEQRRGGKRTKIAWGAGRRRGGPVTLYLVASAQLVDLVDEHQRVAGGGALEALHHLAGHGAHIGTPGGGRQGRYVCMWRCS